MTEQNSQTHQEQDDIITIDFKAFFGILKKEWWVVVLITGLIVAAGGWYAFTAREEFVSEGRILPEMSGGSGSSLGGLASLVGIGGFELGLKNGTDAIRPDLYPDIIQSTPFFLELFKQGVITQTGDSLTFDSYYHQAIEEDKVAEEINLKTFEGQPEGVIIMNRVTEDRIKDLKTRINGNIDKKSGVINITVKMPDPVVAAGLAKYVMKYLTDYVTDYRTEKSKQDVDFLGRKVASARGEFYGDQARKARYADQFALPTMRLQSADIQRERIESEYKLSSTVYNELLKKYEEAKIKLQQETPVFQVLEPPVAPTLKSEPKKSIILLASAFTGFFFSVIVALAIRKNYKKVLSS
jgi:uncharacterized protein involved in exopolysaccharide biosynthesis